jgi:preprotein translocase subunit SecA
MGMGGDEMLPGPMPGPFQGPMPGPPAAAVSRRKVGRNDPCPCGSGKKYKKCCLLHEE